MTALYLVSEEEGAGKTTLCATLAHKIRQSGKTVGLFKPVAGAGLSAEADGDAAIYSMLLDQQADGWPADLPNGGLTSELLDQSVATMRRLSEDNDLVLVEGSSALSMDESKRLADALEAKTLVVARYDCDLSAARLRPWLDLFGETLLGFVVNGLTRYSGTEARTELIPSMESEGLMSFGVIPEDRRLLGVTVGQLTEHLGGRLVIREEGSDALVEHLMVGGMGMDPGQLYFGLYENKAVIVRGDRPDIQMAALETPTACMVFTEGVGPIEYVKYEAEQEEVSVTVVETDTLATMDALNTLMEGARFDHPDKLSRYADLVEEHFDLPALMSVLEA